MRGEPASLVERFMPPLPQRRHEIPGERVELTRYSHKREDWEISFSKDEEGLSIGLMRLPWPRELRW